MEGAAPVPEGTTTVAATGVAEDPLVTVRLLRFPLRIYARAQEHHQDVIREFALLALQPPQSRAGRDVPQRLTHLIDTLGRRYAGATERPDAERDEALQRGDLAMDLEYVVPESAGAAAMALSAVFDEADEVCRDGDYLLALAAPELSVRFRRWYCTEFARQTKGEPPRPWDGPLT